MDNQKYEKLLKLVVSISMKLLSTALAIDELRKELIQQKKDRECGDL